MHRYNNPLPLDLNAIYIYVRVIDCHSFTQAAEELGLTKSTVSRKVAELEKFLGVKLLVRSTRTLTITKEGKEYYQSCVESLNVLNKGTSQIIDSGEKVRGPLNIVAPMEIGCGFLGRIMRDFMRENTEIKINLDLSNRDVDIISDGYDLGVKVGKMHDSALIKRTFFHSQRILVASPDYLEQYGTPQSINELTSNHQQVKFVSTGIEEDILSKLPYRLRVNSLDAVLQAAVDGFGIASLPTLFCYSPIKEGELVHILPDEHSVSIPINFIYPDRKLPPKRLTAFIEYTIQECIKLEKEIKKNKDYQRQSKIYGK
ncbi:LysR family transcriptional regulator [Vibrio sp. SS-MA-C1-2]|uniref:LysR family transcriptional regulator n=1 Tax=Vibrio sp. SS-MA-C1-2 TaxID=2908646 RepID=UPI001F191428|nr:LysR family transcriptional regulator [Vibrio sp. SS-MA-C1-2]UJF16953.1 LysR family transcriptional regulator [Vibrio sp. SS-MA-C1-2]